MWTPKSADKLEKFASEKLTGDALTEFYILLKEASEGSESGDCSDCEYYHDSCHDSYHDDICSNCKRNPNWSFCDDCDTILCQNCYDEHNNNNMDDVELCEDCNQTVTDVYDHEGCPSRHVAIINSLKCENLLLREEINYLHGQSLDNDNPVSKTIL